MLICQTESYFLARNALFTLAKGRAVLYFPRLQTRMDRKVKAETIKEFGTHERDTGSADVQIAVLSRRIKHLEGHLKANKKDHHSRRGLLNMVSRRKRLLKYLSGKDVPHVGELKKQLGIR